MTRRFLDDIRAQIAAEIVDNTSGLITPAQVRGILLDTIDSTIQDECALTGVHTTTQFAAVAPSAWAVVPVGALTTIIGGDGSFLKPNLTTRVIQSASSAGWTYSVTGYANMEAGNNDDIEFSIGVAGVPRGLPITITGRGIGNDRPVAGVCRLYDIASLANSDYQLLFRSATGGAENIAFYSVGFFAAIYPTNNP